MPDQSGSFVSKAISIVINIVLTIFAVAIYYWIVHETRIGKNMTKSEANTLFDSFWQWRMKDCPEFATFVGNHDFDDQLDSYSLAAFESRKVTCQKFLNQAKTLHLHTETTENTWEHLEIFVADLSMYIKGLEAKAYLFPISHMEGIHTEFSNTIKQMKYENTDDYKKLISRLNAFSVQVDEVITLMQEGIKIGMTNSKISMESVPSQLTKLQSDDVENSEFFKPALKMPESIDAVVRDELQKEIKEAIAKNVFPSFEKLKAFLEKEYMKHLRPEIGISTLPDGKHFYQLLMDFHLGFNTTPQEVHDIGIKEVELITQKMKTVIQKLELDMSVKEFSMRMVADKTFYFKNPEEILEAYKGLVFNEIYPKLPKIIKNIPSLNLSIEAFPSVKSGGPGAFYLAGTPDGSRDGVFYVNVGGTCPKYEMMTLALHEGVPGHHLQMSYMMEMKDLPAFRQYMEDKKYYDPPAHFAMYTSYIEGWGLYSEYLGYELGLYDDPYLEYGHLSYEMFRACRLVVDTGIHFFGWSKERAVDYLADHTALGREEIIKEVDRYITWPGQALGYKIGQLKIKELRRKAAEALGEKFDVKEFHDVVLRSAGPLSLLQRNVLRHIETTIA